MNQLNFVPEYKECIGLGARGQTLISLEWHVPITRLLAQVLVIICVAGRLLAGIDVRVQAKDTIDIWYRDRDLF